MKYKWGTPKAGPAAAESGRRFIWERLWSPGHRVIVLLYAISGNVVATVNGEKIYKDELFEALNRQAGSSTLEQLIIQRLIAQEARSLGLQVSQEEVDGEMDRFIETALGGDHEKFKQVLDQYNISEDTLRWEIELDLLLQDC